MSGQGHYLSKQLIFFKKKFLPILVRNGKILPGPLQMDMIFILPVYSSFFQLTQMLMLLLLSDRNSRTSVPARK